MGISLYLQKLSTSPIAISSTSTKTDNALQTSVKLLRATTMCSTFTTDCRYDKRTFKFIGNVFCLNTMCSGLLCVHKGTFQYLSRTDYQCTPCTSTCQGRNVAFDEQSTPFFLKCGHGIYVFEDTQYSIQDNIGDVFCPERYCSRQKCVYIHTWKENDENCYECP